MRARVYKTKPIELKKQAELNFSQKEISGFDLEKYQSLKVLLIGAGAIGTNVGLGLARKGIGSLTIFDHDFVELKNLTRQLFSLKDLKKNKAVTLAKILSKQGFFKSIITGCPYRFQEALEMGIDFSDYDAIVTGVDNNPTRVSTAKYCLKNKIPLITGAVSRDGNRMSCVIQEPDSACFGCIMPHTINDNTYPCAPGVIDIIQVVSGFTVYALDTIVMQRHREWNMKMVSLDGSIPGASVSVPQKADCKLCGKR